MSQDVGFNADVRIRELGSPDKLINGFGPELFGAPLNVRLFRMVIFLSQNSLNANLKIVCGV